MLYAVVFFLLAGTLTVLGVLNGPWGWFLFWPALSLGVLAMGYAGLGPAVLGKQPDGRLAWWAAILHAP